MKLVVRLLTKKDCGLCVKAKQQISLASRAVGGNIVVEEVDLMDSKNKSLYDKYIFDIPVGLLEDGHEIFRHYITEAALVQIYKDLSKDE